MIAHDAAYLDLLERLLAQDQEHGFVYDLHHDFIGATVHLHREGDNTIVRLVLPMEVADKALWRDLAYTLACELLSETTNNDACDVVVRERSAHLESHHDLAYLQLEDDFGYVVVDAIVLDYLT